MGNLMETCTQRALQEEEEMMGEKQEGGAGEFFKEKGLEKSMRVKVVLTKEELEWLLFQLQIRGSGELQAFLGDLEMMRSRENKGLGMGAGGWKPSLESITECPELPHTMDR
ncbi:PREDICTED: uncharacterized protein LOC109147798 [Ipomoea nil]|uniref:uncharacterized protein LOC109147798 n=1 Tax=Ipomoea nil TaxID=35883 RepID=UPI0009011810|nr:PREDICTED: uncharacterized protein LOC109147798 [Ipomoea nil]